VRDPREARDPGFFCPPQKGKGMAGNLLYCGMRQSLEERMVIPFRK
jgi:hypothetical protein